MLRRRIEAAERAARDGDGELLNGAVAIHAEAVTGEHREDQDRGP